MNTEWKTFLERSGGEFDGETLKHFGNPQIERQMVSNACVLSELSEFSHIQVKGPDADVFLQGQVTCDMRAITPRHFSLGAHCNLKGRVVSAFRCFQYEDAFWLRLPKRSVEPALNHLKQYSLFSKVEIAAVDTPYILMGLAGSKCDQILGQILDQAIEYTPGAVLAAETFCALMMPGEYPRFEIMGPITSIKPLWEALDVHAAPVGYSAWRWLDIHNGIVPLYPETSDCFTPQMLNLDKLGAVSFNKGCYLGQEIIARTHYKGKPKRHLYQVSWSSDPIITPGEKLLSGQDASHEEAGILLESTLNSEGVTLALAVLHERFINHQELYPETQPDHKVSKIKSLS